MIESMSYNDITPEIKTYHCIYLDLVTTVQNKMGIMVFNATFNNISVISWWLLRRQAQNITQNTHLV
jgi:hypothetical protein